MSALLQTHALVGTPVVPTVAALYVATDGAYANLPGVDPWDQARDARLYAGPHPVVAHPPCQLRTRLSGKAASATPLPFRDLLLSIAASAVPALYLGGQ